MVRIQRRLTSSTCPPYKRGVMVKVQDYSQEVHIYPTPPLGQDMTQSHFLSGV